MEKQKRLKSNNEFINCLQKTFQGLWEGKGVPPQVLLSLKTASGNALDFKYHGSHHQDLNEYLCQLFEYTHQQFKPLEKPNNLEKVIEGEHENEALKYWNDHVQQDFSLIGHNFEGLLCRTRKCPEGHTFRSFEVFRILPLQFPRKVFFPFPPFFFSFSHQSTQKSKQLLLADLLENFKAEENLEWYVSFPFLFFFSFFPFLISNLNCGQTVDVQRAVEIKTKLLCK
jgi:hypothetical protein